jgi:beta-lactamase regulating signal transducer with metallopeptidase domain
MPYLAIFWMMGMLFLSSRMFVGLIRLHTFSKKGIQVLPDHWQSRFEELKRRSGIRRIVDVRLSEIISVPITYKFLRPIVLLPVSVFTGLSDEQIEVLLLHELAHIKRHDYLVNLLQSFIEVLFFYHPLIWWISKNVRAEREHCCDDMVMNLYHQPMLYAQTLTQIQSQHYSFKTHLAMSANGNKGVFTQRIYRLFKEQETPSRSKNSAIALLLLIFSGTMMAFYPTAVVQNNPGEENVPTEIVEQDTMPEKPVVVEGVRVENIERVVVGSRKEPTNKDENKYTEIIVEEEILYEDDTIKVIEVTEIKRELDEVEIADEEISIDEEIIVEEVPEPVIVTGTYRIKKAEDKVKIDKGGELLTVSVKKGTKPLVFLDNKPFKDWTIDENGKVTINIPTEKVHTVNVYKGSKLYGSVGAKHKGEVIEIFSFEAAPKATFELKDDKETIVKIRVDSTPVNDKPLFVIDGVISNRDNIDEEISPDEILSISVLKGNSATFKYGEDGQNGVVEIITKRKKAKLKKEKKKAKKEKKRKKLKEKKEKKAAKKLKESLASLNELAKIENSQNLQLSIAPNPTNNITNIKIDVAKKGNVRLEVYNVNGQLMTTLANTQLDQGTYNYEWDSSNHPAGSYFINLNIDGEKVTKQLIVKK